MQAQLLPYNLVGVSSQHCAESSEALNFRRFYGTFCSQKQAIIFFTGVFFLNSNWYMNNFTLPPLVSEIQSLMLFESVNYWKKHIN